MEGKRVISTWR